MALPSSRSLANSSLSFELSPLVISITSVLQTLNPQKSNPKTLSFAPLNGYSPHLDPNLVIQVIKNQTNPFHALFFFNWASNPNPNPRNYSHNNRCYEAITDVLLSNSLFTPAIDLLRSSGKLTDFFVGKLIKAFGDRGNIKAAIFWFHQAKAVEKGNCLFSLNSVLGVLVGVSNINLANSFFHQTMNEGVIQPDISTYTTLVRGFCKLGMMVSAKMMFDEMSSKPNLLIYNIMINGYCKKGDMESAKSLFHHLINSEDFLPDTVTYTTLIDGYCKKGEFEEAQSYLQEMEKNGCAPNILTYNSIIYGLCVRGNVDEAKRMVSRMRLNGVKDNAATHTSILKGLRVAGKSEEAVEYFKWMFNSKMNLDAKAYAVVVNEYCNLGKVNEALSILREMGVKGIHPSVSSFNSVIRALVKLGELDRAILLLKQMPRMGCLPNYWSYSTVICGLCIVKCRMQDVEYLVRKMVSSGIAVDATMYTKMVEGYCEDGNEELALQVAEKMTNEGYLMSLEGFSVLVKESRRKGRIDDAEKIVDDISMRSPVADVNSYRRILDEHEGPGIFQE